MSPALACPRPSAADIDARSPEGWNRRAAASVLQASGLRSDVTVVRLNTAAGCQSCSETALRRNTRERVYRVEAAIARRSQVQILPPLLERPWKQRLFFIRSERKRDFCKCLNARSRPKTRSEPVFRQGSGSKSQKTKPSRWTT